MTLNTHPTIAELEAGPVRSVPMTIPARLLLAAGMLLPVLVLAIG